jgi:apolipoprotein N-acyltransferase
MPTTSPATAVTANRREGVDTGVHFRVAGAAALASGVLISSCFLWFQLFPLAWIAFTPLLWALPRAAGTRQAALLGLLAGLATNIPAFHWLVYTIHVFGGFAYPLALFFYAGLSLYSATQFILFAIALRRTGPGPLALAAPLLWVALEFLFPNLFPWRMANSQFLAPTLIQIGDLAGPFALSFVMLWVAAAVADLVARRRAAALVAAAVATAAVFLYGSWRLPQVESAMRAAPATRVALVQGNISIERKGNAAYFEINLDEYRALSEAVQGQVDLLVWPETTLQHWVPVQRTVLEGRELPFAGLRTHLIFGGLAYRLRGPQQADQFNSAFVIAADGSVLGRYDKRILMPFGEFIPMAGLFPSLHELSPETGNFTAGTDVAVFEIPGAAAVGPLICYEDLAADMSRRTTQAGAEILLNILNDAWYGDTAAPHQHQALALWRAVENRRYLLRGSNTGVTSIIDAAGRVVAEAGVFRSEVIRGSVPRMQIDTFYTRFGNVFAWFVTAAAVALLLRSHRQPA